MFNFVYFLLQSDSLLLRHDKVYSILAILLVIFATFVAYLILTQRKVSQLEKKIEELEK